MNLYAIGQIPTIDSIMRSYTGEVPGAALMLIKDGRILHQKGYGLADLEARIPVSASSNFRLASVSKQFTAASILILAEKKLLHLNQPLTAFFNDFPAYGAGITIRHLLTHTSGIPDYEDFVSDTAFHPQVMDQGVLDILREQGQPYFKPGTRYRYSNSAYALLALIVEQVSGKAYPEFLKENIFIPLGMNNTLAYINGVEEPVQRAYGYSRSNEGAWKRKDQSSTSAVLGDGGIYANLEDMFKWDQSLYTEKILPFNRWKEVFTPAVLNDGELVNYGFGWHLKTNSRGEQVHFHTGSSTSFRNIYYRIPERRLSLVLLTNRNEPAEFLMVTLAEKLLEAIPESQR